MPNKFSPKSTQATAFTTPSVVATMLTLPNTAPQQPLVGYIVAYPSGSYPTREALAWLGLTCADWNVQGDGQRRAWVRSFEFDKNHGNTNEDSITQGVNEINALCRLTFSVGPLAAAPVYAPIKFRPSGDLGADITATPNAAKAVLVGGGLALGALVMHLVMNRKSKR